jgi:hypothetical protein
MMREGRSLSDSSYDDIQKENKQNTPYTIHIKIGGGGGGKNKAILNKKQQ